MKLELYFIFYSLVVWFTDYKLFKLPSLFGNNKHFLNQAKTEVFWEFVEDRNKFGDYKNNCLRVDKMY